jgi:hypothetical protein
MICHVDGRHWDVLIDAEVAATPDWRFAGSIDPTRCEVTVSPGPGPGPDPTPAPPADVLKPVLDALADFRSFVTIATTHLHDDLTRMEAKEDQLDTRLVQVEAGVTSITNQLIELQARPFPEYQGRVIGWPVTLRPQPVK